MASNQNFLVTTERVHQETTIQVVEVEAESEEMARTIALEGVTRLRSKVKVTSEGPLEVTKITQQ